MSVDAARWRKWLETWDKTRGACWRWDPRNQFLEGQNPWHKIAVTQKYEGIDVPGSQGLAVIVAPVLSEQSQWFCVVGGHPMQMLDVACTWLHDAHSTAYRPVVTCPEHAPARIEVLAWESPMPLDRWWQLLLADYPIAPIFYPVAHQNLAVHWHPPAKGLAGYAEIKSSQGLWPDVYFLYTNPNALAGLATALGGTPDALMGRVTFEAQ